MNATDEEIWKQLRSDHPPNDIFWSTPPVSLDGMNIKDVDAMVEQVAEDLAAHCPIDLPMPWSSNWRRLARHVLAGRHLLVWDRSEVERAADLASASGHFGAEHCRGFMVLAQYVASGAWQAASADGEPAGYR